MTTRHFFVLTVAALLIGCSSSNSRRSPPAARNPFAKETMSAGNYLTRLHQLGLLPGDSKASHGGLISETDPAPLPDKVDYPFSRTFHVVVAGEPTKHYTVTRVSEDAPWELRRAWQTDSQGRVLEEWPVK